MISKKTGQAVDIDFGDMTKQEKAEWLFSIMNLNEQEQEHFFAGVFKKAALNNHGR